MRPAAALPLICCLLAGCYSELKYDGDGQLVDHGPLAAHQRFVVELGRVDLSRQGTYSYRLARLPRETFTIGLQVQSKFALAEPVFDSRPLNAAVRFELTNEKGEVIVAEGGPLPEWVWSGTTISNEESFVYRTGTIRRIPTAPGASRAELTGQKPDAGWGSYFTPRPKGDYHLVVAVETPDPQAASFTAIIKLVGGGWK